MHSLVNQMRKILPSINNSHLIMTKSQPWTWSHFQMVLGTLTKLVGRQFMMQRRFFWLAKYISIPHGMKSGFGPTTEMGEFALKRPRSILGTITFLYIHIHFIRIGRSICWRMRLNYFLLFWFPEHKYTNITATLFKIYTDPVFCLFECLFSAFLNVLVQYQQGGGGEGIEQRRKRL